MSLILLGLGTAQPPHAIDQRIMADNAAPCSCATDRQRKLLPALYRRAHVDRRHSVVVNSTNGAATLPVEDRMLAFYPPATGEDDRGPALSARMQRYPEEALPLATEACRAALDDAGISPGQIGQLVVVSCTGFSAPGVDIGLIDTLGLPATVGRSMVGFMGCHGAMNGLRLARSLAESQCSPDEHVLMCCVELCTLHFQYGWDPQKVVANALFADGAAAVVGKATSTSPPHATDNDFPKVAAHGSCLLPDSRDLMTWIIRDHGFEMTLSAKVPDLIREHLADWFTPWLAKHQLAVSDIQGWAIHPGGPRVISAVEEALDLPQGAGDLSRQVLRDSGNMSSPTVLFILDRLRQNDIPRPWIAIAFGPGLTIEATLMV
ncbi:MAG: type III polyketide synthase [Planctomycetota bacterium]